MLHMRITLAAIVSAAMLAGVHLFDILHSYGKSLLELSALVLSIVNGLMLLKFYLRDRARLTAHPVHPEIYQWWFRRPDGEFEGKPTRRYGFIAYIAIQNSGLRKTELISWRLFIKTRLGRWHELKPINMPEPSSEIGSHEWIEPASGWHRAAVQAVALGTQARRAKLFISRRKPMARFVVVVSLLSWNKSSIGIALAAAVISILCGMPSVVFAQSTTGFPPFGSFSNPGPDVINLANLNIHLTIPVVRKAGRGLPIDYNLSYDGTIWYVSSTTKNGTTTYTWAATSGWTGLSLEPALVGQFSWSTFRVPGQTCSTTTYTYFDPAGTAHDFGPSNVSANGACGPSQGVITPNDGSGYLLTLSGGFNGGEVGNPALVVSLYDLSGNQIVAPGGRYVTNPTSWSVTDPNGNVVSTDNSVIKDTLNMTVLSESGSNPQVFSYTGPGSSSPQLKVNYTSKNVATYFGCSGINEFPPTSQNLVSSIALPDGSSYQFTYESTPHMTGDVTGRVSQITLPTGGTINYTYPGSNDGIDCGSLGNQGANTR